MLTYTEVTGLREDGVDAVDARDRRGASACGRGTRSSPPACGPSALTEAVTLRPSRGSHLLVRAERLGDPRAVVNVKVPGERGRWVFAIPRADGLVAIGLTDVAAPGEPADEPRARPPPRRPSCSTARRPRSTSRSALATSPAATPGCGRSPPATGATADLSRRHAIVEDPAAARWRSSAAS